MQTWIQKDKRITAMVRDISTAVLRVGGMQIASTGRCGNERCSPKSAHFQLENEKFLQV